MNGLLWLLLLAKCGPGFQTLHTHSPPPPPGSHPGGELDKGHPLPQHPPTSDDTAEAQARASGQ